MQPWMKRAAFLGLLGGFGALHVSLVGMVGTFQARDFISGIVTVGSVLPMLIAILVGWRAGILQRDTDVAPTSSTGSTRAARLNSTTIPVWTNFLNPSSVVSSR